MRELFSLIENGDVKTLITAVEEDSDQVNVVSIDGLSLFEALLNAGYTTAAEHFMSLPKFDINHQGHNPLRIAVAMGCIDLARSLLEKGASPNYRPEGIASALLLCLENEYFDLAELMVEQGAEVDIRNDQGWTPLIWASLKGRRKAVDFLIEHGANIHACNNDGWNAVTGAYFKKRTDLVNLLLGKGAVFGARYAEAALLSAYENGYGDVVSHLLDEFNTNPNVTDAANISLLAKAVDKGDWDFVKTLLEKDADVNLTDVDGVPVLAVLAGNGHKELIALLLEKGADIHLASESGLTAIYLAAKNNQLDTLQFLIERGADINVQTTSGWTPLMVAAARGYLAIVQSLVEAGANQALMTEKNQTAKTIAYSNAPRIDGISSRGMESTVFKTIVTILTLPGHLTDGDKM